MAIGILKAIHSWLEVCDYFVEVWKLSRANNSLLEERGSPFCKLLDLVKASDKYLDIVVCFLGEILLHPVKASHKYLDTVAYFPEGILLCAKAIGSIEETKYVRDGSSCLTKGRTAASPQRRESSDDLSPSDNDLFSATTAFSK